MRTDAKIILAISVFILFFILFCGLASCDEIDDLIPYIINVESSGNPYAISEDGCIGLMQISGIVLKEYKKEAWWFKGMVDGECIILQRPIDDLTNPFQNIYVGAWYLRRLKNHYLKDNYTIERLLCAWNGGITRLRKLNYDCSKMPKESRRFCEKVLKLYERAK